MKTVLLSTIATLAGRLRSRAPHQLEILASRRQLVMFSTRETAEEIEV